MPQYAPVLELSSLNGVNGFRLTGVAAGDQSGFFIGAAGDLNGDGIDDIVVGSWLASPTAAQAGAAYVIYGSTGAFAADLNLSSLNGGNGFRLTGAVRGDNFGVWATSAGDINADGIGDLVVGAWTADPNGVDSGAAYVVFGTASGFPASLSASALNGANGFRLSGVAAGDNTGFNASAAGDVNGDGIGDLIVSANQFGVATGTSYVVFGSASGFAANINLSSLNGTNGFSLGGSGWTVSGGDINGDGFSDIIVGAPFHNSNAPSAGATYVVFGAAGGFAANINLSALNGTNGFRISGATDGDKSGYSVSVAGDVNGDGFDDIIIGSPGQDGGGGGAGAAYVVFGAAGGFGANLNLSALNGANGFRLTGAAAGDNAGFAVHAAGDFNGDGFDDVIVGAVDPYAAGPGAAYVVFGAAGGFAATLSLGALDGNNGLRLNGATGSAGLGVSRAGDVNNDGFDDIMVGAPFALGNTGVTYVVFGAGPGEAVTRTGTAIANTIRGGNFNDTLSGLAGVDTLSGGAGDDILVGGAGADALDGGAGSADWADYSTSLSGVNVNLLTGAVSGGDAVGDTFVGIEYLRGSAQTDTLTGNTLNNWLFGGAGGDGLNGGDGGDLLQGEDGDDTLSGGDGVDSLAGGNDNDTLIGGAGADSLGGGAGIDTADYAASLAVNVNLQTGAASGGDAAGDTFVSVENVIGSAFDDTLIGHDFVANALSGGDGNDVLSGGDGGDALDGGAGSADWADYSTSLAGVNVNLLTGATSGGDAVGDTFVGIEYLRGSAQVDTLTGNTMNNWLFGGAGGDGLNGGDGGDLLQGEDGDDTLSGGDGVDSLAGGNDNDTLIGGAGADSLGGGAGIDTADYSTSAAINVNLQANVATGGDAAGDTFASVENVIGSAFADTLTGRDGFANTLNGGDGADVLSGGTGGADVMNGGAGIDTLDYSLSPNGVDVRLFAGAAAGGSANGDTYSSIENIIGAATKTDTLAGDTNANSIWGGGGNETITGRENTDTLYGESGNDTLLGGADSDVLIGGIGADTLGGGSQDDTADYSASDAGVTVNLQTGSGLGGHAQGDVLVSIEDVIGSAFADVIIGKNNVWDNVFDGRGGNDTYTGGLGNDVFVFRLNEGADTITDFVAGGIVDAVQLAGFGANFDSFAEIIAAATQIGADTIIDFGAGQTLTLQNVTLANLTAADFLGSSAFGGDSDQLIGGIGANISDFVAGGTADAAELHGFGGFAEFIAAATQVGADAIGAGQAFTPQNVAFANFTSGDFLFLA